MEDDIKVVDLGAGNNENNESTVNSESAVKSEATMNKENTGNLNNKANIVDAIPKEYKPISTWGYFGYEILFSIPIIGFIILIIFALGGSGNQNVKNFARSKFCLLVVALALIGVACLIAGIDAFWRVLPNLKWKY